MNEKKEYNITSEELKRALGAVMQRKYVPPLRLPPLGTVYPMTGPRTPERQSPTVSTFSPSMNSNIRFPSPFPETDPDDEVFGNPDRKGTVAMVAPREDRKFPDALLREVHDELIEAGFGFVSFTDIDLELEIDQVFSDWRSVDYTNGMNLTSPVQVAAYKVLERWQQVELNKANRNTNV